MQEEKGYKEYNTNELKYSERNIFGKLKTNILILDAPCGAGKSTAIINYINNSPKDCKFIYITPLLSEVDRIIESCPEKQFKTPTVTNKHSKKMDFINMINKGCNIVSTHALFQMLGKTQFEIDSLKDYILILDEVINVIDMCVISKDEKEALFMSNKAVATIDEETGRVKWKNHYDANGEIIVDPNNRYRDLQEMANLGTLYYYGDLLFIWTFPTEIFQIFKKSFILTYMFNGQMQKGYYDMYDIEYKYLHITHEDGLADTFPLEEYQLIDAIFDGPYEYNTNAYKQLINICDKETLNRIGENDNSLTKAWYGRARENGNLEILGKNLLNYFKNIVKSNKKKFMWTTFVDFTPILENKKNYSVKYDKEKKPISNEKGAFLSCNMRATNDFRQKQDLAYLINVYYNPIIKNFFVDRGGDIDESKYALSELIQWIFRSGIRDGKPINLYIPSSRMRNLLEEWLEK